MYLKHWKKLIWIPIFLLLGYGIWFVLKLRIYDIKVSAKPLTNEIWEAGWVRLKGNSTVQFPTQILGEKSDSIGWPLGINIISKSDADTANFTLSWPQNTLPLQVVKIWKDGFAYAKVLRYQIANTDDTVFAWDENYNLFLRMDNPNDKTRQSEIYKENFDENNIVLTLEKPNPIKIVALWENYLIKGETDGKVVKITVPRAATKIGKSLIRVWVCDSTSASRTCEIPLNYGIIQTKMKPIPKKHWSRESGNLSLFYSVVNLNSGIGATQDFIAKMETLLQDENYVPVIVHGDMRGMHVQENVNAIVCSYFGKKIVCVFNANADYKNIVLPIKGDLKHSSNGNVFKQKGNNLLFALKGKSWEILY